MLFIAKIGIFTFYDFLDVGRWRHHFFQLFWPKLFSPRAESQWRKFDKIIKTALLFQCTSGILHCGTTWFIVFRAECIVYVQCTEMTSSLTQKMNITCDLEELLTCGFGKYPDFLAFPENCVKSGIRRGRLQTQFHQN